MSKCTYVFLNILNSQSKSVLCKVNTVLFQVAVGVVVEKAITEEVRASVTTSV